MALVMALVLTVSQDEARFLGALEESLKQESKTLGDCSLLNESKSSRNCLSQPFGSKAWTRDYKAGHRARDTKSSVYIQT